MPTVHDVIIPNAAPADAGAPRPRPLTGVDVLKWRETHGGKAPPRGTAAHDSDGSPPLSGVDLLKYRETHAGKTPKEVAAEERDRENRRSLAANSAAGRLSETRLSRSRR
jgi:hypothetical protein